MKTKNAKTNNGNAYTGALPQGLNVTFIDGNWIGGDFKGYTFSAKIFAEGSEFGLNGGRVSKLMMHSLKTGKPVFNYDRGMDVDHKIGHEFAKLFETTKNQSNKKKLQQLKKLIKNSSDDTLWCGGPNVTALEIINDLLKTIK